MKTTQKLLSICLTCFMLSACGIFRIHAVTVQQGNQIQAASIKRVKPDMTQQQVENILGTPMLVNTFRDDRFNYVYTRQVSDSNAEHQQLTVYFKNGKLVRYETDKKSR